MPKKTLQPAPAELVTPGQPSAATLAKLKAVGAQLTDEQIALAVRRAEELRVGFQVAAIEAGLLLLAKKQTLKHGEWLPWLEKFTKSKCAAVLHISTGYRSLHVYTQLTQHFLAHLEQGDWPGEERDVAVLPPAISVEDALALQTLPEGQRAAVTGAISSFVGGRSLRRMLMDFRRAESAADQEEIEEANRRRKKEAAKGGGAQLDFYDDMQRPIDEIERLMEDTALRETVDAAFWKQLATALEEQAKRARALAKEARS